MEDIINDYRPTRDWRKRVLEDVDEFHVAWSLWAEHAQKVLSSDVVKIPKGFPELTHLLAWVCDVGPGRIDPTPFTDLLGHLQGLSLPEGTRHGCLSELDVHKCFNRAVSIHNRITFLKIIEEGGEPEVDSPLVSRGRPVSEAISARNKEMDKDFGDGLDNNAIVAKYPGVTIYTVKNQRTKFNKRQPES